METVYLDKLNDIGLEKGAYMYKTIDLFAGAGGITEDSVKRDINVYVQMMWMKKQSIHLRSIIRTFLIFKGYS